MDRTSVIVLAVCFLVLIFWNPLVVDRLYPRRPITRTNNAVAVATSAATLTNATATSNPDSVSIVSPGTNLEAMAAITNNAPEEFLVMTNENARYTFTSRGGGLKLIELIGYPATNTRGIEATLPRLKSYVEGREGT